jgi:two-component system nitrogen regulation sensor histidine kinase GlnL
MSSSSAIIRFQDQAATQPWPIDALSVLGALAAAIVVIDRNNRLRYVNAAAEQFFRASAAILVGQSMLELASSDSALNSLIEQCRRDNASLADHSITLDLPRVGKRKIAIAIAPIVEIPGSIVASFQERSIADQIDRQMTHRDAVRSVGAMASVLAHEIKNPLSGIRGAAQLLENGASAESRELTSLICEEADRIVALVDRMETFADARPIERRPVNIHQVLEHVRRIAENGFGRGRRFVEEYDPSLPLVHGNRDLLVQMFLNLMKNACEATSEHEGVVTLSTRYQHGVRVAVPGSKKRLLLPLLVSIADNGPGIPADVQSRLFDPFVTTKQGGKGLGLAMVAKILGDHDGTIEFSSQPRRTAFSVRLPAATPDADRQ